MAGRLAHREVDVAGSADQGPDLVSKLERLTALRQSGDLSADEFEQAKRTLLGGTEGT